MALTVTVNARGVFGNKRWRTITVTGDSSYAGSGGESITPADVGLTTIDHFSDGVTDTGHIVKHDNSASKLTYFWALYSTSTDGVLTEVTSTTDLSTADSKHFVFGT